MKEKFIDKVFNEECLQGLRSLPDNSVDCCVTSPPYYALRDYGTGHWEGGDPNCPHYRTSKVSENTATGHKAMMDSGHPVGDAIYKSVCPLCGAIRVDEQIGLEETPEEYIRKLTEVFMEVHRVLKPEGTLWLNIGDSYWGGGWRNAAFNEHSGDLQKGSKGTYCGESMPNLKGNVGVYKNKDLIGIPWALATALRQPYYNGKIKNEKDRVWLAAMLDSEGSITGTFHERSDGTGNRTQIGVCITNANTDILSKCQEVYGFGSTTLHQKNGIGHLGKRDIYRWNVNGVAEKQNIICELYPYLIAKRKQAIFAYNFFLLQKDAKKIGHSDKKDETNEKRKFIVEQISLLNKGNDVDIPTWCIEPPTLYTKGWYLRQDIIWHKPNPMPESVTDRCTKSHEYIFLLSKSQQYYYDYEAIQEQATSQDVEQLKKIKFGGTKYGQNDDKHFQTYSGKEYKPRTKNVQYDGQQPNTMHLRREQGLPDKEYVVRNKRDVWSVNVKPDRVAHFATYPEELITPCILAGCPSGGVVLDPFMGSGTTARVARKTNRHFVGFELNPEYCKIIEKKIQVERDLFY